MGNEVVTAKKRIEYLDIAKGIGIILVVCSHAHMPYRSYITHFHMPMFFLISGFLFNTEKPFKEYFVQKLKLFYIPFIFWNILVHLLRMGGTFDFNSFSRFSLKVLLTFTKDVKFMSPTWFLGAMFTELMLYKVLDRVIKPFKYKRWFILLLYILRASYAFYVTLPYKLSRTFILGMFLVIGHLVRENVHWFRRFDKHIVAWLASIVFVLVGHFVHANVSGNDYSSPVLFVIGALAGSYFVIYISRLLTLGKWKVLIGIRKLLCYFSKRSIDILIWHKMSFVIVVFAQLVLFDKPLRKWLKYFPVYVHENGWWIIYVVVGIVVSLLGATLLRAGVWGKLLKKIHVV